MSDQNDIRAQFRGLMAKRAAINEMIESTRKFASAFNVDLSDLEAGDEAPAAATGGNGEGGRSSVLPKTITHTTFLGMKLPEAIQALLGIVGKDMTAAEIRDGILAGGFKSTGDSEKVYAYVFTTLKRLFARDLVWKREEDGKWGLAEWYPTRKKSNKPATASVNVDPQKADKPAKSGKPTSAA